jgi:hypothetical protein
LAVLSFPAGISAGLLGGIVCRFIWFRNAPPILM